MQVTLIGLGGAWDTVTPVAREALEQAELIVGAARLLESLPREGKKRYFTACRTEEIFTILTQEDPERACVVFSGDTGFYSGARLLLPRLREHEIDCHVLPGLSSVQLLAARLGRPWQDWTLCSAHGTACDPISALMRGAPAFFLTGGTSTPDALCRAIADAGLGELRVTIGENLAAADERLVETTAAEAASMRFAPLSVLLTEAARPDLPDGSLADGSLADGSLADGSLADELFVRGNVPMTKQEVRAVIRSKLRIRHADTVWDVGAGTGSISVELALAAAGGRVYGVERAEEAWALIEANRRRFGAWNLRLVRGTAPEALAGLPAPDAVFVGGSGGYLREILTAAFAANPAARLCVSAIALETLEATLSTLRALGRDAEVTQLAVAHAKPAGTLHLLTANNPIFLITVKRGVNPCSD